LHAGFLQVSQNARYEISFRLRPRLEWKC
jgi:hypothetical protein